MKVAAVFLPALLVALFLDLPSAAAQVPLATASVQLDACVSGGDCKFVQPPVTFPFSQYTDRFKLGYPISSPSSTASETIAMRGLRLRNQPPETQVSASVIGFPGSSADILFTSFVKFTATSNGATGPATARVSSRAAVTERPNGYVGGDVVYSKLTITDVSANTIAFSSCASLGSICPGSNSSYSTSQVVNFVPGVLYAVQIEVALSFDTSTAGYHRATASMDQIVTNLNPSQFQLSYSPNLIPRFILIPTGR